MATDRLLSKHNRTYKKPVHDDEAEQQEHSYYLKPYFAADKDDEEELHGYNLQQQHFTPPSSSRRPPSPQRTKNSEPSTTPNNNTSSSNNNINEQIDRTLQELKNLMDATAAQLYPVKAQLVAVRDMPELNVEQEAQLLSIFGKQHNPTRAEVRLAAAEVGLTEQHVLSWLSHHFAVWRITQGLNPNESNVADVVAERCAHQPPEHRRARFSYYCKRTTSQKNGDDEDGRKSGGSRNSVRF